MVYNTDIEDFVAIRILSQAFGSLGAVVAWFRTVNMIQANLEDIFGLVFFAYVDDSLWVTPSHQGLESPGAQWVFEYIVTFLLGLKLDPDKSQVGSAIILLGLD